MKYEFGLSCKFKFSFYPVVNYSFNVVSEKLYYIF